MGQVHSSSYQQDQALPEQIVQEDRLLLYEHSASRRLNACTQPIRQIPGDGEGRGRNDREGEGRRVDQIMHGEKEDEKFRKGHSLKTRENINPKDRD